MGDSLLELSYLIAALLFVYGLKLLSHPATARTGNLWAAGGMGLAMVTTLLLHKDANGSGIPLTNVWIILAAIGVGSAIGWMVARRVKMTAMPQLVSIYNATGGAASMLVALLEYPNAVAGDVGSILVTVLGLFIGAVAFSGSLIAFGKLDGRVGDIMKPFMTYINLVLLIVTLGMGVYIVISPNPPAEMVWAIYALLGISLVYGVMFVMPIGGADMPVVISLLNSFTGIAAAMAGFIYNNQAMILGGILVGAAGMILTMLMCKAMNRSLINVIIGSFGGGGAALDREQGNVKEITLSDAAVLMSYSQKIVVIPGYGLAVAQAQHIAHELDTLLEGKGVDVKYAIHPVAGRMPGHMNVLLAEADVPYENLVEMDDINPDMPNVDVAIVIGANDVVNPAAYDDPSSPIYGMPIIDAHLAKNIIIMKRGMGKGYAGIENFLFFNDKTRMLFGDAKSSISKLVNEIKSM
ncbi:MAG: NAD(P)(+) transhydrogenase (Re/Si-specific) subunit beta [Prolixibacteraceae bacterium]|nr:NAD(P)(+) transhydrogenase (Re/Si-specific) subunit beta [Prolixibacteraceae bacterium]MBT6006502.1 NAD(P)(+) transhydrogenase (Re/Si-specific) subunit beta [Prolixibacteraceae bacterium]MBT6764934.1 NAD(P)(+) transhydrogenase (Re/Si-specific) subunit beta [Prolixibacteraceae bacterium]MBT6997412.1 NAD(P)(+) transhydrogenase (Re/Si-specific) subunit beta [Prolixibacteraceae bacterium]MBT7396623.1 NAD(P)(+) transhydrogenase (Re/Si-specific) subunit beta [Prolixibacteraceae bacterium]